jgi:hypothetical protein
MSASAEVVLAIGGVAATAVAAFRSRFALKSSRQVIKIQAGDKEWRIDTIGKSQEEIDELLKGLSGKIEDEVTEPAKPQAPSAEPSDQLGENQDASPGAPTDTSG